MQDTIDFIIAHNACFVAKLWLNCLSLVKRELNLLASTQRRARVKLGELKKVMSGRERVQYAVVQAERSTEKGRVNGIINEEEI